MKISLITPSYNSAATIARTIESVISQDYADLEYIIIDGNSSDETAEIVASYQDKINIKFISEPDDGIYDAMNKGIKMAMGEVIGIINSDDLLAESNVVSCVMEKFRYFKIDMAYGDINYFSDDVNRVIRYWRAGEYREARLRGGWAIPHPALFVKSSVYHKCGFYDSSFKIAGDYEFMLRALKVNKVKIKYIPKVLVKMYNGGVSGANLKQRIRGWKELRRAWVVNNFNIPCCFIFRRLLSKVFQLISRC